MSKIESDNDKKIQIEEAVRYIIAGASVTVFNLFIYHMGLYLGVSFSIANLIAIVFAKIYGFLVNKLYVYKSHCNTYRELFKEIFNFIVARGITGVLDFFGVLCLVDMFLIDKLVAKYVITGVIIVLNYILGKKFVFKKDK